MDKLGVISGRADEAEAEIEEPDENAATTM
jgi:hypothetical protein